LLPEAVRPLEYRFQPAEIPRGFVAANELTEPGSLNAALRIPHSKRRAASSDIFAKAPTRSLPVNGEGHPSPRSRGDCGGGIARGFGLKASITVAECINAALRVPFLPSPLAGEGRE
jgi:hypothetical protein